MGDNQRIITQFINTVFLRLHNYSMYHQLLSHSQENVYPLFCMPLKFFQSVDHRTTWTHITTRMIMADGHCYSITKQGFF